MKNLKGFYCVVLNSGGYDSVLVLHELIKRGVGDIHSLFFNYGQISAHREKSNARYWTEVLSRRYGEDREITHTELEISIPWATSAVLGNSDSSYLPMRNLIFLSYAISLADEKNCKYVAFGRFKQKIELAYHDSNHVFHRHLDKLTKNVLGGIRVIAPLRKLTKTEVFKYGYEEFGLHPHDPNIWSCDLNAKEMCGNCPSCIDSHTALVKGVIP